MKSTWKIALLGFALLAGGVLHTLSADSKPKKQDEKTQKEEKKEPVFSVDIAEAAPGKIRLYAQSSATLRPERQVEIFAKAAGQIVSLAVEEGDWVEEGQVLASLDGESARLEVEQSRIQVEKTRLEWERIRKSHQEHLVSQEEFEVRQFQYEQAQSQLRQAEHRLGLTAILAPFRGTILRRSCEKGQTIQPSQTCFVLAQVNPMEADIFVPEAVALNIRVGQQAQVSREDGFSAPAGGRVKRVSPEVDAKSGTVKVTLAMENLPAAWRPGTYAHIRIVTESREVASLVPAKALMVDSRQICSVFVVQEGTEGFIVRRVEVKRGAEENQLVEISAGLNPGDRVVVTGKESLVEGARVQFVSPALISQN